MMMMDVARLPLPVGLPPGLAPLPLPLLGALALGLAPLLPPVLPALGLTPPPGPLPPPLVTDGVPPEEGGDDDEAGEAEGDEEAPDDGEGGEGTVGGEGDPPDDGEGPAGGEVLPLPDWPGPVLPPMGPPTWDLLPPVVVPLCVLTLPPSWLLPGRLPPVGPLLEMVPPQVPDSVQPARTDAGLPAVASATAITGMRTLAKWRLALHVTQCTSVVRLLALSW